MRRPLPEASDGFPFDQFHVEHHAARGVAVDHPQRHARGQHALPVQGLPDGRQGWGRRRGDGVVAERQRRVLAGLNYSRFIAADDDYLNPVRELIADQALTAARASGDRAAATRAERTLERLRASREVQP